MWICMKMSLLVFNQSGLYVLRPSFDISIAVWDEFPVTIKQPATTKATLHYCNPCKALCHMYSVGWK